MLWQKFTHCIERSQTSSRTVMASIQRMYWDIFMCIALRLRPSFGPWAASWRLNLSCDTQPAVWFLRLRLSGPVRPVRWLGDGLHQTAQPQPLTRQPPNRPAIPDCTHSSTQLLKLLCLKDLEQTRPFFPLLACLSMSANLSHRLGKLRRVRAQQAVSPPTPPSVSSRKFYLKSPR